MSYRAIIHDLNTGRFLLQCSVEASDLHEAENAAISKAALSVRGHPREMDVRHLHELPELSRTRCRQVFEERFSAARMTEDYLKLFAQLEARPL